MSSPRDRSTSLSTPGCRRTALERARVARGVRQAGGRARADRSRPRRAATPGRGALRGRASRDGARLPGSRRRPPSTCWSSSPRPSGVGAVDTNWRLNFPNRHPLCVTGSAAIEDADCVLFVDVKDMGKETQTLESTTREVTSRLAAGCRVLDLGFNDVGISSWSEDYAELQPVDVQVTADTTVALPLLLAECRLLRRAGRCRPRRAQREAWRTTLAARARRHLAGAGASRRRRSGTTAPYPRHGWRPRCGRWCRSTTGCSPPAPPPAGRCGPGTSTGRTGTPVASSAPRPRSACRSASPLRTRAPDVSSSTCSPTATSCSTWARCGWRPRYELPLLVVMFNNRAYYNDWEHQERLARQRGTPVERAHIGMAISDPAPDFAAVARGFGWWAEGPVEDPAGVQAAVRRAAEHVAVHRDARPSSTWCASRSEPAESASARPCAGWHRRPRIRRSCRVPSRRPRRRRCSRARRWAGARKPAATSTGPRPPRVSASTGPTQPGEPAHDDVADRRVRRARTSGRTPGPGRGCSSGVSIWTAACRMVVAIASKAPSSRPSASDQPEQRRLRERDRTQAVQPGRDQQHAALAAAAIDDPEHAVGREQRSGRRRAGQQPVARRADAEHVDGQRREHDAVGAEHRRRQVERHQLPDQRPSARRTARPRRSRPAPSVRSPVPAPCRGTRITARTATSTA